MRTGERKRVRLFLNKKGSYIIEAAIVLPVIMLTVITSVLIIMFFYTQMTEQCRLHEVLRAEAGRVTDKTIYLSGEMQDIEDTSIHIDKKAIGGEVTGKKYLVMEHKGIINKRGTFTLEGHSYAVDGTSYVRASSIIRGKKNE